jgi:cellulose synthase/poly-beta-1,6-N-acetylglucosamine synthase-like glycosyltransferase
MTLDITRATSAGMTCDIVPKTIGVMIATYRRPNEIVKCLTGLDSQVLRPNDVIIVAREDDLATKEALATLTLNLPIRLIHVAQHGVVAARNTGLFAAYTDILAIIDDDTVPHSDWLSRIMGRFQSDPALGGLGGRDRCFSGTEFDERQEAVVGKVQWFGRVIGNHHRGFGDIREVDVLKGANMSFRKSALNGVQFDSRLKGNPTQPNDDKCFSLAVKTNGWKLAYDPAIVVDHYPGYREDARQYVGVARIHDTAHFDSFAYNEVVSLWDSLSVWRRLSFFIWSCLLGTSTFPGFLQALRFTPTLGLHSWYRFWIAQKAKLRAFHDLSTS